MAEGTGLSFFELDGESDPESLAAWIDLGNSAAAEISGNHDEDRILRNPAGLFEANAFREIQVFGLGLPQRPDGLAEMAFPLSEDLEMATFRIFVRVGCAAAPQLFDEVLRRAAEAGRHRLRTFLDDRDSGLLELYLGRGFAEKQRITVNVLPLAALRETALIADPDYALEAWQERCPDELIDSFAALCGRMSTDAPQGEAVMEEQVWEAGRVRRVEEIGVEQGRESQVTAVRHRSSGDLVGYTVLSWHPDRPVTAMQGDTLVIQGHRGRGLGLWIKTANVELAQQRWPSVERIYTGNAEDNLPMLRINQKMGFVPDKTFRTLDLSI